MLVSLRHDSKWPLYETYKQNLAEQRHELHGLREIASSSLSKVLYWVTAGFIFIEKNEMGCQVLLRYCCRAVPITACSPIIQNAEESLLWEWVCAHQQWWRSMKRSDYDKLKHECCRGHRLSTRDHTLRHVTRFPMTDLRRSSRLKSSGNNTNNTFVSMH